MFCCTLLYVHSSIAIILMGKRELIVLLNLSSWCLVMVEWLFLVVPGGCLRFVIVVFPDHTHYFYTLPHFSVWILCYTFRSLSVCPSVRAHHFRSITWVSIHQIFSNFAYKLLSAMSGMGLLMGKIRPFFTELLSFFVLEKWFLACYSFTVHDIWMKLHRYAAHQRLHIVTKDRHSDLPSLWVIRPW